MAEEQIEVPVEAPVETPAEPSPEQVEAEGEARKYGWKAKEEFDLAPEGWVDANRFLELPSTQVKMLRDTRKQLEREIRERDEKISGIERTAKTAVEAARKQERERYEAQLAELKTNQRKAAEVGDVETFDRLAAQEAQMRQKAPEVPVREEAKPQLAPEISDYMAANTWTKNPQAIAFAREAIDRNPEVMMLPPIKQVQWAEKKVQEYFPELFDKPKAPPARVDGGGLGIPRRSGKSAADLPADVRAIGKEFVEQGLFKDLDAYAKDYFAQG